MLTTKTITQKEERKTEGAHLIGKFVGDDSGATLLVFGSVHGNEPGGAAALRQIVSQIEKHSENLRGRVYFLAGNTRALMKGLRFIDSDLNRHWTEENLAKNRHENAFSPAALSEDREQRELLEMIDEILTTAKDEVYALDLHSTSAEGLPFATVGDTMRNRHFAQQFPVTILLGIEEQLEGTLLEYLNNSGTITLGFEGGQHNAPETIENHAALVWLALVNSGMIAKKDVRDFSLHYENLKKATKNQKILEVRHREAITPDDEFEMNPGFENFDPVKRGQFLARNKKGAIKAPESGVILMPLYQKLGEDGFFIGREVEPFWLRLSKVLRKMNLSNYIHVLPGVRRHPQDAMSFIVNTRVARFFPLQIFHLLGFRKRRWRENNLVVSRRAYDTKSPFKKRK